MNSMLSKIPDNVHSFKCIVMNNEWNNNPNMQLTDLRGVPI